MSSPDNVDMGMVRVLVVEDDPDQRALICDAIGLHFGLRAQITAVGSGKECLAQDMCQFDIALLDYNLPDTLGADLLVKVLQQRDLPVVFVTSEASAATAGEAIRRGAQDYVIKLGDYLFTLPIMIEKNLRQHALKLENARLQAQLKASLEEICVKNIQLEESLAKLQQMAATDHLSGLANRRAFAELLERYYNEAVRYNFDLTCVMCDLDHYKSLNDTLGHQVGDRVLMAASAVIRDNLRSSDTAARYGGDEFVLLLPHTSVDLAVNVAERIRQQLTVATRVHTPNGRGITMSIGVASLKSNNPSSADALVAMADRALYVAKDHGKNCIVTYGNAIAPAA